MNVRTVPFAMALAIYTPHLLAQESVFWPSASPENGVIKLERLHCNSGPYQPKLPKTIGEFRALGKRIREQVQPAGDYTGDLSPHTSGNFWYDGMHLGVVFRNAKPYGSFLEGATFSHSRWNQVTPIKVGSSVLALLAKENIVIKPPITSPLYLCNCYESEGAPDCVRLTLNGHVIVKVEYQCYTG